MKKAKRIIAALSSAMLLSTSIFAQAQNITFKATVDNENISVAEDNLTTEIDNSDLNVKVYTYANGTQNLIYTGALGSYDNGAWSNIDFSKIQFLVIFEWDNMDSEPIYIVPCENESAAKTNAEISAKSDEIALSSTQAISQNFETVTSFWNETSYCEYLTEDDNTVGVDFFIKNKAVDSATVQPYFAMYNNNKLVLMKTDTLPLSAEEQQKFSNSFEIPAENRDKILTKLFAWNTNMVPVMSLDEISTAANDLFGNTFDTAVPVSVDKNIKGKINYSGDIDVVSIKPNLDGYYSFLGNGEINIEIYNAEQVKLSPVKDNLYFLDKENYYIKIFANDVADYDIAINHIAEQVENISVNYENDTDIITVSGNVSSGEQEILSLTVYNPDNECEQLDDIVTNTDGTFSYSYKCQNPMTGTYQAVISNYKFGMPLWVTFDNTSSSQYISKSTKSNNKSRLVNSSTVISIDGVANSADIQSSKNVTANVEVINNSVDEQEVTAILAFYAEDNHMTDYLGISKNILAGESENFSPTIKLPSDDSVRKIKVFIIDGNGVYDNSNIIVSEITEISDGEIKKYMSDSSAAQTEISSEVIDNISKDVFSERQLETLKNTILSDISSSAIQSSGSYTPWGVQFNQTGEKINVELGVKTNDTYYENFFTQSGIETYNIKVKNKQNKAVYFLYYINTSYEREPGDDIGVIGDRYFHIKTERLAANSEKTFSVQMSGHPRYQYDGEHGHQVGFGVADLNAKFDEVDWFDVNCVNLYPSHRLSFGNSFDNAYNTLIDENSSMSFSGNVSSSGDIDYIKIVPAKSNDYIISSTGNANVSGELFKGVTQKITSDNTNGSKAAFSLSASLAANTEYYLKVKHNAGKNQGDYKVVVSTGGDPYIDKQWGLKTIDAEKAWKISTGAGVKVAVFDGEPQFDHEDIGDNMLVDEYKNFTSSDEHDHPTHIAGIIAAKRNNGIGISGVAPDAKIVPVNNGLSMTGMVSIPEAIAYVREKGVSVVNISSSTSGGEELAKTAMQNAPEILFVCSAGNRGISTDTHYPSGFELPNVISVANMQESGGLYSGSNHTKKVHVAAPGTEIYSTLPTNTYGNKTGTSMAAPFVSGIAALISSKYPNMSGADLRKIIENSVIKSSSIGSKVSTGGYVNAYEALQYAKKYKPSARALRSPSAAVSKMNKANIDLNNYIFDTTDIYVQFLDNSIYQQTLDSIKEQCGISDIEVCCYLDFVDTYKIRIPDKEQTRTVVEKLLENANITYAAPIIVKIAE